MHLPILCAAVFMLPLSLRAQEPAPAAERRPLIWKLERGEELRYRVTRVQALDVRFGARRRHGELRTTETFAVVVEAVGEDGVARLRLTLESFQGKLTRDDGPGAEYDSRRPAEPQRPDAVLFESYLAELGHGRQLALTPHGVGRLLEWREGEPPQAPGAQTLAADRPDDERSSTGWLCLAPSGAELPQLPLLVDVPWEGRHAFPSLLVLEHGLAAWPTVATEVLRPAGTELRGGLRCDRYAIEAELALDTDDPELARSLADGTIVAVPGQGRGSLSFAAEDGLLARFQLEGASKLSVNLPKQEQEGRDVVQLSIDNELLVELLDRRPPARSGR